MITQKRKREELQLIRDEVLEAYMNREDFQYDADGDALYQHYKDQYTQLGQKAMQDTMGQAATLTGGYGSSYAQNVGQQAYNSYMQQLGDVVPELYQLAYDRYQEKGNRLYQTYQTWADLEQQAAQQEQWEQEYELAERERQDAHNRFLLEQESKNNQTQNNQTQTGTTTNTSQPDYWAMLAYYRKLGLNTQSQGTPSEKAETANTFVAMTKTQQTEQFVANTESWETVARSGNGYESYEEYLKMRIDSALSKGQLTSGEAAWLISHYSPQIGESTDDQYTSDRFKQLQKQVKAQMAADVDESYIESFLTDAREFVLQTEEDISNLTWSTATSDQALDKYNASAQAIKDRANKVRAWLDANKSRITQDSYQQYIQYLDDFADFLDQSADYFKRTTAEFSRFETQEQYDQTVQEYEQTQGYYDKYSGMTANQLTAKAASLPEGKEKDWVLSYAAQTPKTKEELQQELVWAQGQYEYLNRLKNEGAELAALKNQLEASTPGAPGYDELKKRYENMLRQYPTMSIFENLDSQIAKAQADINNTEKAIRHFDLSSNADYEEKSKYLDQGNWLSRLVNDPEMAGKLDTAGTIIKGAGYVPGPGGIDDIVDTYEDLYYQNLHLLEDEERKNFNYLFNTQGEASAREYLDTLQKSLNARSQENISEWVTARTKDIPVFSQFYTSLLRTPLRFIGGVPVLVDVAEQKLKNALTGSDETVDFNTDAMILANMGNTIQSSVTQQINDATGTHWLGDVYNLGMSMNDSAVVAIATAAHPIAGKVASGLLSASAAADTMREAAANGATDNQAITLGLAAGFFEFFFEKYEIASLMKNAGEKIITALIKQAFSETVGEGATELSNIVMNTLVMAEKSDVKRNAQAYLQAHPDWTEGKARAAALKDTVFQILKASGGGLLSGSIMGSGAAAINAVFTNFQNTGSSAAQANISNAPVHTETADGGVEALLNSADKLRSVSLAEIQNPLTSQTDKVDQNANAKNVVQPNSTVQTTTNQANATANQANTSMNPADVAESLKGRGIPSWKIDTLAEAIVARVNGQELTRTQRDVLRFELGRPVVQRVINDLIQKKSNGIDSAPNDVYDDSSIRDGLTNEENAGLQSLADQSLDAFSGHDYIPAAEGSPVPQSQNTSSDGTFEGDADVTDNIITDGSHLENGKLKPNVTYKTGEHDYFYSTNADGLIVNARTEDLQFKTHEGRLKHNPNTYGKETGDHAGHLFGDRFGGSPELDNLVSQAENVNKREYRQIEEQWAKALKNGQKVTVNIDIHYDGGGVRPSSFDVTYTIDDVSYHKIISNQ